MTSAELVSFWNSWVNKYPIASIEDGLDEDDWTGWKLLTDTLEKKCQLVGDDLFVTNTKKIGRAIRKETGRGRGGKGG